MISNALFPWLGALQAVIRVSSGHPAHQSISTVSDGLQINRQIGCLLHREKIRLLSAHFTIMGPHKYSDEIDVAVMQVSMLYY